MKNKVILNQIKRKLPKAPSFAFIRPFFHSITAFKVDGLMASAEQFKKPLTEDHKVQMQLAEITKTSCAEDHLLFASQVLPMQRITRALLFYILT